MIYLDLFSGIGGFHKGIEEAGVKIEKSYFSEVDKYATQIYKKHFPEAVELGDIRKVDGTKLGHIDLITFGFPCTDLSIAGKRAGLAGSRSGLFFEAIRIIKECKPSVFIFENVKGIFSSNNGKDFELVLRTIADIGLYECEWQLVNTAWLLPQNRERIYFIGHLGNIRGQTVFPIRESDKIFNHKDKRKQRQGERICSTIDSRYGAVRNAGETYIHSTKSNSQGNRIKNLDVAGGYDTEHIHYPDDIMKTLRANAGGRLHGRGVCVASRGRGENNEQQLEPRTDGLTNTLTEVQKDNLISSGMAIRRLTPVECEKLQGFSEGWTQYGNDGNIVSDSQRYRCLGNAVTVPIVKMIIERLYK